MTEQEDNTPLTSTSSQMEGTENDAGLSDADRQVFSQKFNQAESWLDNENETDNTDESNEEVDDFFDDFDPLEAIKTTPEVSLPETEKQTTKTDPPPSTNPVMLALSSRQTLENINELFLRLQEDLAETETIELDASAVTHIDAATLQLFVALQQTAAREQKTLIINFPSEAFIEAAQLLGMEKILELDQAAAGFF